jgi:hypothetical protein
MRLAVKRRLLLVTAIVALASPSVASAFRPKPVFGTPGKAAYCYVDATNFEDLSPRLFCWTPSNGLGTSINWRESRGETASFAEAPRFAENYGLLKGYAPRARLLAAGTTWTLRCAVPGNFKSCSSTSRKGVVAFSCVSRKTGLTCTNAAKHGVAIGRSGHHRLF